MNLQIAEAQPLFCKERLILLSVSFVYVLIRLENKRPVLLHDGERGGDAPRSVYGGRDGASHSPALSSVTNLGSGGGESGDEGVNRINRIIRLCLVNGKGV